MMRCCIPRSLLLTRVGQPCSCGIEGGVVGFPRFLHITINPSSAPNKTKSNNKSRPNTRGQPSYRFVDRTRLKIVGGTGGKGCLSVKRIGRGHKRRPDGGHGGRGGNVVLVADPHEQSLRMSHPHITAENGTNGSSQDKFGRNGENRIVRVPCGVVVRRVLDHDEEWEAETQTVLKTGVAKEAGSEPQVEFMYGDNFEDVDLFGNDRGDADGESELENEHQSVGTVDGFEPLVSEDEPVTDDSDSEDVSVVYKERERVVLADLDKPGSYVLVARGGQGGHGNHTFASKHGPMPDAYELIGLAKPTPGEVAFLELELKLIADLGLVGFPNSGKSSLLAAMSRATPKIAPYPFTTLHPLVGTIEYRDGFRVLAADVPGLVDGASEGRGRGHDFLRHLERTKTLLYMVDAAGVDGRDPVEDFRILVDELRSYGDGDMLTRPALVAANKVDLLSQEECESIVFELGCVADEAGLRFDGDVLGISAGVTGDGLGPLSKAIRRVVSESEMERENAFGAA